MKNIEDELFPGYNVLADNEDGITATIVDAELDPFECRFNNDGCVEIDTNGWSYITLSLSNLATLKKMIIKAEKIYEQKKT